MNHFDFPLQLEVFQRNISRGLTTVLNPTLLAKQIKVGASLEKKAFAGETKQSLSCFTKLLSPIWGERDFLQYFLRTIYSFAIFLTWILNNPCGRRYLLFWDSLFDRKYVVGFLLKKKMLPIQILVQDHRLNHLFPIWWILFVGGGWVGGWVVHWVRRLLFFSCCKTIGWYFAKIISS